MKRKKWIIILGILLIVLGIIVIFGLNVVPAQSRGTLRLTVSKTESAAALHINDEAIGSDTVTALADSFQNIGISDKAEAYQNAVNLLAQNALFHQEATKRGLIPSDSEVAARVQQSLSDAGENNQQLRNMYIAQASALGTTWDSPQFKAYLTQQTKEYLPVEKLNALIDSQVNGDQQKFNLEKAKLLTDLLAKANLIVDTSSLPPEAQKVHIPIASELPVVANLPAFPQTIPSSP